MAEKILEVLLRITAEDLEEGERKEISEDLRTLEEDEKGEAGEVELVSVEDVDADDLGRVISNWVTSDTDEMLAGSDIYAHVTESELLSARWVSPEDEKREAEAYGYLSRLLQSWSPSTAPLPTLISLCTQIEHALVGVLKENGDLKSKVAEIVPLLQEGKTAEALALLDHPVGQRTFWVIEDRGTFPKLKSGPFDQIQKARASKEFLIQSNGLQGFLDPYVISMEVK